MPDEAGKPKPVLLCLAVKRRRAGRILSQQNIKTMSKNPEMFRQTMRLTSPKKNSVRYDAEEMGPGVPVKAVYINKSLLSTPYPTRIGLLIDPDVDRFEVNFMR